MAPRARLTGNSVPWGSGPWPKLPAAAAKGRELEARSRTTRAAGQKKEGRTTPPRSRLPQCRVVSALSIPLTRAQQPRRQYTSAGKRCQAGGAPLRTTTFLPLSCAARMPDLHQVNRFRQLRIEPYRTTRWWVENEHLPDVVASCPLRESRSTRPESCARQAHALGDIPFSSGSEPGAMRSETRARRVPAPRVRVDKRCCICYNGMRIIQD